MKLRWARRPNRRRGWWLLPGTQLPGIRQAARRWLLL